MSDRLTDGPTLLYGVGATKAGTSWLYRYLADHPDCHLRTVKELHYWDSFPPAARDKQLIALRGLLERYRATRAEADQARPRRGWQVENMTRRIADLEALIPVIEGARQGDARYYGYLTDGAGSAALVGDLTPAYGLLPKAKLARMADLPGAKFLLLMRDPVERLWSHVRMQARRQCQPGETPETKAPRILNRAMKGKTETHIPERGDYKGMIERLRAAVPSRAVMVEFAEAMFTPEGLARICRFLGISHVPADTDRRVHESAEIALSAAQRAEAAAFLRPQYEFVEGVMGYLPDAWQSNRVRA